MVTLEESCILDKRRRRNRGVNGVRQSHVWIGLKTNSLQPYAYLVLPRISISIVSNKRRGDRSQLDALFPATEFVVHGEGNAFLEFISMVRSQTDHVSGNLHTKRDIEILRDVMLGPEKICTIFSLRCNGLHRLPTQKCVVSDERCSLARPDGKPNSRVDLVGEESDAVLEVITDDLHDTGTVLHDGHLGRKEHLCSAIEKAVNRL